jgi:ribosome biogenesis GTPase
MNAGRSALDSWGFGPRWAERLAALGEPAWRPARVVAEHRERFEVIESEGERSARSAGRLRLEAANGALWPAVGDWVAVTGSTADDALIIHAVLSREGAFRRAAVGGTSAAQVVAANVDRALLVNSLDQPLNLRRLERYLALAWDSGAMPLVVLSKSDLATDAAAAVDEAATVAAGAPVLPLSALTGAGLEALAAHLVPGMSFVLVGLSGAGKSTLVNALAGTELLATGAVREIDGKGRHTTTHRQLIRLPSGALAIDTPGMRELGLVDAAAGLRDAFADVDALATACRFKDCVHAAEPGCAVRAAIESGALDAARLESWHKLRREDAYHARRHDAAARAAEEQRWKGIHKSLRNHPKYKR